MWRASRGVGSEVGVGLALPEAAFGGGYEGSPLAGEPVPLAPAPEGGPTPLRSVSASLRLLPPWATRQRPHVVRHGQQAQLEGLHAPPALRLDAPSVGPGRIHLNEGDCTHGWCEARLPKGSAGGLALLAMVPSGDLAKSLAGISARLGKAPAESFGGWSSHREHRRL